MTLSPDDRRKIADRDLAQAKRDFTAAQQGRDKLNALVKQHQADYDAALQDWSRDKSDAALSRMTTARSQLTAVKELLQEDVTPYAKAEAELARCEGEAKVVAVVSTAIDLSRKLQRQQDYFAGDFNELQRQHVELMDKLRKTADAWDALHQQQYVLAQEAGLTPEQLQRRVEAWGFDANPLKRVLVRNPLDGNDTMAFRRTYQLPDAVDGSDLAQYAKRTVMQGLLDHYNDKGRRPALQHSHAQSRPVVSAAEEDAQEERELARRQREAQAQVRRREEEAAAYEAAQDAQYGVKPRVHATQTITRGPVEGIGEEE